MKIDWLLVAVLVGAGCGGVNDSGDTPDAGGADDPDAGDTNDPDAAVSDAAPPTFGVNGTVTGFAGSGLVLRLNGATDLTISGDGAFSFPSELADGATYEVTVAEEPTCPHRVCAVEDGSGTIDGADASGVTVTCEEPIFRLASHNWGAPQSIRLTDDVLALADGATAAPRIVTGASTGVGQTETDSLAADRLRDLIYVPAQSAAPDPSILVFEGASTITGDVAPARQIVVDGGVQFSGIELDEEADRLYVSGAAGQLYVFDGASALDGTVTPTATIEVASPGALSLDREADRLYVAGEGGALFQLDGARALTSKSAVSRTMTWTNPTDFSRSVSIDGCRDRLYLAIRSPSSDVNIFVFDDASTLTGALDLHVASQAQLEVPDNQVMSTALDSAGHLYFWEDSATAVHIVLEPHLLAGAETVDPDLTINAVVASGYGLDVTPYAPPPEL